MKTIDFQALVKFYQNRFAFQAPRIAQACLPNTQLIIVIPCFNEPSLLPTIQSLIHCESANCAIEVIIVINSAENTDQAVKAQNQKILLEAQDFLAYHSPPTLNFIFLIEENLPAKSAGVGLARKIGMDEALARFEQIDYDGGIVCLDADCIVAPNYLRELQKAFQEKINFAAIYFEHCWENEENEALKMGIIHYEIFLRYYINALKSINYPFSFHTVGSSMAVRASIYAQAGGMNKRQAGEDFYFLHKLSIYGGYKSIHETCVFPAARVSDRVPFGTGKAQSKWIEKGELLTYSPQIFSDLKAFFDLSDYFFTNQLKDNSLITIDLSKGLKDFLAQIDYQQKLKEIRQKSKSLTVFKKHFWAWWDGFMVLKAIHYLRDLYYPEITLLEASQSFLESKGFETALLNPAEILQIFRNLDKLD